nr:hypothetical protein [Roseovarius nitratireducens]
MSDDTITQLPDRCQNGIAPPQGRSQAISGGIRGDPTEDQRGCGAVVTGLVCWADMTGNIHCFVQNANDEDVIVGLLKNDQVATRSALA